MGLFCNRSPSTPCDAVFRDAAPQIEQSSPTRKIFNWQEVFDRRTRKQHRQTGETNSIAKTVQESQPKFGFILNPTKIFEANDAIRLMTATLERGHIGRYRMAGCVRLHRHEDFMRADQAPTITVLAVSSSPEDHASLQAILAHSHWRLYQCSSHGGAIALLSAHSIGVVIVDTDLRPGTWRDLLSIRESLPGAPQVIVASRLADDRLWAEALNLGAYDVLAKPFHAREVFHSVSLAWRHWKERCEECACAAAGYSEKGIL